MKLAILLTATVQPLCRQAAYTTEERAKMYHDTLAFYSQTIGHDYPFVILENSDYDLTPLKREFADKLDIEWLQFTPNGGGIS